VAGKVPRVGLLGVTSAAGYARQLEALRRGFRDLGYVEGQNIVIEYRWADGRYDRLPALAAELIRLQPDVLVTSGPGLRVLKDATTTIPIVFAVGGDVVADGIVASLARPGGNITGSAAFNMRRLGELSVAKRLPGAGSDEYAEGGGLLAYGVHFPELWRRAPYFVDKILKGGKPATIPVEQALTFTFVINLKTARTLELPIQQSLLFGADHVIH